MQDSELHLTGLQWTDFPCLCLPSSALFLLNLMHANNNKKILVDKTRGVYSEKEVPQYVYMNRGIKKPYKGNE